jgi:hypothetical protein
VHGSYGTILFFKCKKILVKKNELCAAAENTRRIGKHAAQNDGISSRSAAFFGVGSASASLLA